MKTSQGVKLFIGVAIGLAIALGVVAFATREERAARGLTVANLFSPQSTGERALVQEFDAALRPAYAEREKLKATIDAQKKLAQSSREKLKADLSRYDAAERAAIVDALRSDSLPDAYRDRVDVAQALVDLRTGLAAERELKASRAALKELDAQIKSAEAQRDAADRRAQVDEMLAESGGNASNGASVDVSESVDRLVALTEEASQATNPPLDSDPLKPADLLADVDDAAEKTSYLETLDAPLVDDDASEDETDDFWSDSSDQTFMERLKKKASTALTLFILFVAAVIFILVFGVCYLFKATAQVPLPPTTNGASNPPAQVPQPSGRNWGFAFFIAAIVVGAFLAGPFGVALGAIVGAFFWQWRFGARILGGCGAVAVALLAVVVLFIVALCKLVFL